MLSIIVLSLSLNGFVGLLSVPANQCRRWACVISRGSALGQIKGCRMRSCADLVGSRRCRVFEKELKAYSAGDMTAHAIYRTLGRMGLMRSIGLMRGPWAFLCVSLSSGPCLARHTCMW